ncbi:hypothetical protein BDQ94DRAFT_50866 [Aspergillus welwitschiae]|uniref:Uncharacterized protein n=1 Tax=Aspergillus welwitschiae TaxID=1341132 RepID=A0A3F3PZ56_9EURO|nr:hypothetical protein BDQ94DRAFT_50866 [Aspergillus welwitschiae]RDH32219.1 hypothetical protein BDQ94DRAFT_50866 [Aspergillus welwitschiae]
MHPHAYIHARACIINLSCILATGTFLLSNYLVSSLPIPNYLPHYYMAGFPSLALASHPPLMLYLIPIAIIFIPFPHYYSEIHICSSYLLLCSCVFLLYHPLFHTVIRTIPTRRQYLKVSFYKCHERDDNGTDVYVCLRLCGEIWRINCMLHSRLLSCLVGSARLKMIEYASSCW